MPANLIWYEEEPRVAVVRARAAGAAHRGTGSGPETGQRDLRTAIVAAGAIQIRDDRGPRSAG
jgi:hypothetical protein